MRSLPLPLVGLVALVGLVFARALSLGFVGYDDPLYVTGNEHVLAGLDARGLAWSLTTFHGGTWLPVTWWSHLTDASLFGANPAGHHATSVLLHVCNAGLASQLARRLGANAVPAALAAGLWAVHPLRVESVAWVASRKDVVSGLWFLLTLLAWLRWTERPGVGRYLACALCLTLGLASKQVLVTTPFVLLLLDAWPLGRRGRGAGRLALEKLPLFALCAGAAWLAQRSQQAGLAGTAAVPVVERLQGAAGAYAIYIGQTLWPVGLAAAYPPPPAGAALAGGVLLLGLTALALLLARRTPALLVGWLWFCGMLVPMLGLVRFGHAQPHADRFTYLPQLGLCLGLVLGLDALLGPSRRKAAGAFAGASLAAFAALSVIQIGVWRDDSALWGHAVEVADSATARFNLGEERRLAGDTTAAIAHLEQGVLLAPEDGLSLGRLGSLYARVGRNQEAQPLLTRAATLVPDDLATRANLAQLLLQLGRTAQAKPHLEAAWRLDPEQPVVRMQLAAVYAREGRPNDAADLLGPLAQAAGANADLLLEHGRLLVEAGRHEEALPSLRGALAQRGEWRPGLEQLLRAQVGLGRERMAARTRERLDALR